MKYIENLWLDFKSNVLPADTSDVQIEETRNAFFAGAGSIFKVITEGVSSDGEPTKAELKMMDDIQEEMAAFLEESIRKVGEWQKDKRGQN